MIEGTGIRVGYITIDLEQINVNGTNLFVCNTWKEGVEEAERTAADCTQWELDYALDFSYTPWGDNALAANVAEGATGRFSWVPVDNGDVFRED